MFKRFRAKVAALDGRSISDLEINKVIKNIKLTKAEKQEITARFKDTSQMVFKELFEDVTSSFRKPEKSTYTEGYLMFGTTKSVKMYSCNGNKPVLVCTENIQLSNDDVSRKARNAQNVQKTQIRDCGSGGEDMLRLADHSITTTELPVSIPFESADKQAQKSNASSTTTVTTATGGNSRLNFCRIS